MVVATSDKVDITELKARHPLSDAVEAAGLSCAARGGCARESVPSTEKRKAASRCTATVKGSGASAAAPAATCWISWEGRRG